ncbi:SnoaL-like polyketide cyclase [Cyclobacterium xiamenense]|uniref:SnoaL-like polyketide cyclase n=1 Tax=Cyclobacterium xiamenense TaxID=1297121 RepID=A0A1H7BIN5_9BACT|nr:ester cyclase [Cyclobacterium xiamenense]SEJ77328.1 SnoaL-like polyketide cyclase [Cyclobacterium xiamenense]
MKATTKTSKANQEILVKKGICTDFFSAYQDMEADRMLGLCRPDGKVSFIPLGSGFSGKIKEVGMGVWSALMDSFPDLDNTVIDQQYNMAENEVTCTVEIFGTQEKDFAGLPSQGKFFVSEHIFIFRFNEQNKIEEIKVFWDHEHFVEQLC